MKIFLLILLLYLLIMNIITIIVTTIDKSRARRGRTHNRIPESTLLFIAALGGAPFMYITMLVIRHKTQKKKFMILLPIISILWIAAIIILIIKFPIWI